MAKRRKQRAESTAKKPVGAESATPRVPTWLPPVLFVGLTLVLFRAFVFSDAMLLGNDTLGLGYVARAFYADAIAELGRIPRWAPLILGGTPMVEALSAGDALYPPSLLLLLLLEPYRALGWKLVVHVAAAGFFMFGWTRALGASRAAALVAGTGYMLAPALVSLVRPGHDGKMFVIALAPLVFWAVERHFVRPRLATFTSIALVVGLVLLTTHFQMAYFLFGSVGMYAIFRSVQLGRGRGAGAGQLAPAGSTATAAPSSWRTGATRFGLFLAASVAGAGIAAVQFVPAVDYVTESSRRVQTTRDEAGESGVGWSSSWSAHPEEIMSLVIPEFAGNDAGGTAAWAQDTYWGRNVTRDNHPYAGLVLLLLAAVSFVGAPRRGVRYFFAGLAALAALFALGAHTPVWRLFYEFVPGIRLFRAPDQVLFLFAFAVATLSALGVDRLLAVAREPGDEGWRRVRSVLVGGLIALGVLALLASAGALTSVWTSILYSDIPPDRLDTLARLRPFLVQGAWLAVILAGGVLGLAWALRSAYLAPAGLLAGLVVLVSVDELRVATTFVQTLDFQAWSAPDPVLQAVLEREQGSVEPYRLLSFSRAGQDIMPALHGIELAAGHHPNDLSRYRELIGMVGSQMPDNLFDARIRRLLNVRYLVWPDLEMGGSLQGQPLARSQLRDGRIYESLYPEAGLARARLVGSAVVKSDDEAVPYMLSEAFDPQAEVVLAEAPPIALAGGPVPGSVRWLERGPDRLRLQVSSASPALLVVADNWYPAWRATVDGVETPILRAYHTLRAVPVDAGEHTVEMWYRSEVVSRSAWVSLLLFLGLVGATGVQWWRGRAGAGEAS